MKEDDDEDEYSGEAGAESRGEEAVKRITPRVKEGSFSDEIFLEFALYEIERCRLLFEAGDRGALLEALGQCAEQDLPMPDWLARAYLRAYREGIHYKVRSWDDVFGSPSPKGKNLELARVRRTQIFEVYTCVRGILDREPNTAIDQGLFERVGKELGISWSTVKNLYYAKDAPRAAELHPFVQALWRPYIVEPRSED